MVKINYFLELLMRKADEFNQINQNEVNEKIKVEQKLSDVHCKKTSVSQQKSEIEQQISKNIKKIKSIKQEMNSLLFNEDIDVNKINELKQEYMNIELVNETLTESLSPIREDLKAINSEHKSLKKKLSSFQEWNNKYEQAYKLIVSKEETIETYSKYGYILSNILKLQSDISDVLIDIDVYQYNIEFPVFLKKVTFIKNNGDRLLLEFDINTIYNFDDDDYSHMEQNIINVIFIENNLNFNTTTENIYAFFNQIKKAYIHLSTTFNSGTNSQSLIGISIYDEDTDKFLIIYVIHDLLNYDHSGIKFKMDNNPLIIF